MRLLEVLHVGFKMGVTVKKDCVLGIATDLKKKKSKEWGFGVVGREGGEKLTAA